MPKLTGMFILMLTLAFMTEPVFAHAALVESVPADAAELKESPPQISLRFSEEVRLLRIEIKDANDNAVDSGFRAIAEASSSFVVPLPALADGPYSVEWTIMSADSHRMTGDFNFRLDSASMQNH